jgi:hypothetical protein
MQEEPTHADLGMNRPTPATHGSPSPAGTQAAVGSPSVADSPASAAGITGDTAVDQALSTLSQLDARPVHEHVAVIENVHQALRDRLADEPADDDSGEGQG